MENKEKLTWVSYLSKHYECKIHLLIPKTTDQSFKRGIRSNLVYAQKYLKNRKIDFDIHYLEGKTSTAIETIEYSEKIEADLILTMTTKNINLADFVMGAREQYIIANSAKLPVMCVNPKPTAFRGGFRAGGG